MKVKVRATGQMVDAFPGQHNGLFALKDRDGGLLPFDSIEYLSGIPVVKTSGSSQSAQAVTVEVPINVSWSMTVTRKGEP